MEEDKQKGLLEALLLQNSELDKLEAMLGEFNVFETLNIVNAEVRHSNVLAWLLTPSENHGLGNSFLKQFLKHVVVSNKLLLHNKLNLFDLEGFNYSEVEVRREWRNIDILVLVREEKESFAIAIENKVKSHEHSDQLIRYKEIIEKEFPRHNKIYIFLTPDRIFPSDLLWCPFDYASIADLLDYALKTKRSTLNDDIYTFLNQYRIILRRYIVGNSEVEQICRKIYSKHHKALDLIFLHRPDIVSEIGDYLKGVIENESDLILDNVQKTYIRFTSMKLDLYFDKVCEGWTDSKRILLFEFEIRDKRVTLKLEIGPGPEEYRQAIYGFCKSNISVFNKSHKKLRNKWSMLYQKIFLEKRDFESQSEEKITSIEDLKGKIDKLWGEFVSSDYRKIEKSFEELDLSKVPNN